MSERVLITGGCGFVGRHLSTALVRQGKQVVLVDPVTKGSGGMRPGQWLEDFGLVPGDIEWHDQDCRAFFASAQSAGFDEVFHLAAIVGGRLAIENQALAVAQDLAIDAAMFEWAAKAGVPRIAYFSSSAAYPINLQTREAHRPLSEADLDFADSIGVPDLSYGWAKLTGEFLGRLTADRYGIAVSSYRPFSGYGADQDVAYPFPSIVDRVLQHQPDQPFVVWGSGQQQRDFIHIEDCVRGILSTYRDIDDGSALNLSTGVGTTFTTLAALIAEVAGKELATITNDSTKPEGVFARVGDTAAQKARGFVPDIELREGIREALEQRADRGGARR